MNPSVLIVGAGPSGLAALKEMREAGLEAISVDSRPSFGGVFAPDSGVTCKSLHLTISNVFMSFSDFPPYDIHKGAKYWSQAEYYEYLKQYVDHFQLHKHIHLRRTVKSAHFNRHSSKWQVSLSSYSDSAERVTKIEIFDKLIVATGANHKPKLPESLLKFQGDIMHSTKFHSGDQVRSKHVLIVGMAESAADVANCASKTAKKVTMCGRRYHDWAPRFIEPYLSDSRYDEDEHLDRHHKPNGVLESLTISRIVRNLPLGIWSIGLQGLIWDLRKKHGPSSMQGMLHEFSSRAWLRDYYSSDTSIVPAKSGIIPTIASRNLMDIVVARDIKVNGKKLTFHDAKLYGSSGNGVPTQFSKQESYDMHADVIVACTGFTLDFGWISLSDEYESLNLNPRSWFKHCFPPDMGEHLAFVGFARPHSGGIPQCSEMVSRYIAQLYKGHLHLPSDYAELAVREGAAERACFHQTPDYGLLVDYLAYMMSVAKLMDCTPRSFPPLSRPLDAVKYWTFPLWPCFFRTRGIGAKPESANFILSKFGTFDALAPMPLLAIEIACSLLMPFVNIFAWIMNVLLPRKWFGSGLPRTYQWRTSKAHFLYQNSLTAVDFQMILTQWLSAIIIVGYLLFRRVVSGRPKNKNGWADPIKH